MGGVRDNIQGQVYDRHLEQLRRDFSLSLALAEQRDRWNADTDESTELQRLASLVEDMSQQIKDAKERVKDTKNNRDLIKAFENHIRWEIRTV
jgi:uncharacterized protein YigA (DUF484 family)